LPEIVLLIDASMQAGVRQKILFESRLNFGRKNKLIQSVGRQLSTSGYNGS
jgi:hypothetical protein